MTLFFRDRQRTPVSGSTGSNQARLERKRAGRLLATGAGTAGCRRAQACTRAKPGVRRGRPDEYVSGASALSTIRSDRRSAPMMAEARLALVMAPRLKFRSRSEMKFLGVEGSLWPGPKGSADRAFIAVAEFFTTSDLPMTIGSAFGSGGDDAGGGPSAQWPPREAQRR